MSGCCGEGSYEPRKVECSLLFLCRPFTLSNAIVAHDSIISFAGGTMTQQRTIILTKYPPPLKSDTRLINVQLKSGREGGDVVVSFLTETQVYNLIMKGVLICLFRDRHLITNIARH